MQLVNSYTLEEIINLIIGKKVHFTSDCIFFPNFDVVCKVNSYEVKLSEIILHTTVEKTNKKLTIGSNMRNLKFEVI